MRSFLCVLAVLLASAPGLGGTEARAQASSPDEVGMVVVKRATRDSLTLAWHEVPGARHYLVERATDLGMSNRSVPERTDDNRITVTGLRPGLLYCFQVRGVNSAGAGTRSHKACQRTVAEEGSRTGTVYRVVTYNICSRVCPGWSARRADAAALVAARRPDVVMLTEATPDSGMAAGVGGMVQVQAISGKALLYRRERFTLASAGGRPRTGFVDLGVDPRYGAHRYAVWAELVDRESHQHVIFVGVHLSPGSDSPEADAQRRKDAAGLVAGIARIQVRDVPVVVAGDFNSYEQRRYDAPSELMREAGFANSFWRAHRWFRGNFNSGNRGSVVPEVGSTWGRHIDHVWAQPDRTQVLKWRNGAEVVDGRYAEPLPSNHNPVLVKLRIDP